MNSLVFLVAVTLGSIVQASSAVDFIKLNEDRFVKIYQDFHRHPELSGKEFRTSKKMADAYRALGLETHEGVGGLGVVGILRNGSGPVIMLRADMDALPVQEETGLPFSSEYPGVMHACGHDGHITIQLATIEYLISIKAQWKGTIVFIAQPAEEIGVGAKAMVEDGLFTRFPKPDYVLGLHLSSSMETGIVGFRAGPAMASMDFLDVTFNGKGGHGARPHQAIDPIVMGAEFTLKLRTINSDEVDAQAPTVLNVGSFHAGTKHNIIPKEAKLELNMRTFDESLRAEILRRVKEVAEGISKMNRASPPTIKSVSSGPSLYNDPALASVIANKFTQAKSFTFDTAWPLLMVSEDFAYFHRLGGIPTLFYFVGAIKPGTEKPWPLSHAGNYAPDFKGALPVAVQSMASAVLELQNHRELRAPKALVPLSKDSRYLFNY